MSKVRLTVSIDRALLRWLDRQVKEKKYANRSHALEFLIAQAIREERKEKKEEKEKPKGLGQLRRKMKKYKRKKR